jgi:hypothetical protein
MEFFINKNADLPLLKMQVVKDGRVDFDEMTNLIENSIIYFSMKNNLTGSYKILNSIGGFVEKTFIEPNAKVEYYIYYKFSPKDTSEYGRYEGEFMLKSDYGTLLLPIADKLFITINDSVIQTV